VTPGLSLARLAFEAYVKVVRFHRARHATASYLPVVALTLFSFAACHGGPVLDLSPKPVEADGTISGTVRGPEGTSAVSGRAVEVVNVDTGERQHGTTSVTGGFTFKVKPGKYRIELALQDGETLVKRPDVIHVNRSDVDAHADFVLGATRVSRPRTRMPRADDGLGAGIA